MGQSSIRFRWPKRTRSRTERAISYSVCPLRRMGTRYFCFCCGVIGSTRPGVIPPGLGDGQNLRRDVGRQDLDIPVPLSLQGIQQRNGDGVGLLARGTPGAPGPDPKPAGLFFALDQARVKGLIQVFKMLVFAEETGQVGADRVDQRGKLVAGRVVEGILDIRRRTI